MKKTTTIKGALLAAMLAAPGLALAGNMPQYLFSAKKSTYSHITDGTAIPCTWQIGSYYVLPGGGENPNDCVSDGWDLGMTFRFGGQEFNRFVITNQGKLALGKDQVNTATSFNVNFSNVMHGLAKGTISYKTTGTPGNRVFTLQYADCETAETTKYKGAYNLQIRLYEADGHVETTFDQLEAPWAKGMGFNVGITGWNENDVLRIHGSSLLLVNDLETGKAKPDMLIGDTYVHWDYYYEDPFTVDYTFTPDLSQAAPVSSPTGLTLKQVSSSILIDCDRAEDAPATVILWSNEPFTASDYPTDGVTFNAGPNTLFGNATALYYGDDEHISVEIEGVQPNTDYYVQAIPVTGYPIYGTSIPEAAVYHTTQAAPTMLQAVATSDASLQLRMRSADTVIIAQTTEKNPKWQEGYVGVFGFPEADVAEGDLINGGGRVIYIGDPQEIDVNVDKNQLNFFRGWTIKDGIVSSTWIDAAGLPEASLPFKPEVQNYPLGMPLLDWDATSNQFMPYTMMYTREDALRATSVNGETVQLVTPILNLNVPTDLTLQFALETIREADENGVARGNEPGKFGNGGFLKVLVNGTEYGVVTQYDGTMTPAGEEGYEDGSATMQDFHCSLPALGECNVTFQYCTEKTTYMFLRNIEIYDPTYNGVGTIGADNKTIDFTEPIYTVTGIRVPASSKAELPAGLYIVGGQKVIVK